ncbi:MAG: hypothetical protein ACR2NZ_04550 [Rubripirellula sp.]
MPGYRAPVLGGKSIAILGGWGLFCGGVIFAFKADAISSIPWQPSVVYGLLQGLLFGIAAGLCWMATILHNAIPRNLIRALVVAALSFVAAWLLDSEWIRQVVQLAGIVLVQSMLFSWVGVPVWRWSSEASVSDPRSADQGSGDQRSAGQGSGAVASADGGDSEGELKRRQFMIIDLLAITTAFACLLFAAGRYEVIRDAVPDAGGQAKPTAFGVYWSVLASLWCVVPAVALCFCLSSIARGAGRSLKWLLGGIVAVCLISLLLTIAELWANGKTLSDVPLIAMAYFAVLITYGATLYLFGAAGVGQSHRHDRIETPESI